MFFRHNLAPAQRAVGDCPPLKESPGRVPAAGEIFFILVININDFFMEIIIILVVFTDVFSNRISMIILLQIVIPHEFCIPLNALWACGVCTWHYLFYLFAEQYQMLFN